MIDNAMPKTIISDRVVAVPGEAAGNNRAAASRQGRTRWNALELTGLSSLESAVEEDRDQMCNCL